MRCPKCKCRVTAFDFEIKGKYDGVTMAYDEDTVVYTCPKCGKKVEYND